MGEFQVAGTRTGSAIEKFTQIKPTQTKSLDQAGPQEPQTSGFLDGVKAQARRVAEAAARLVSFATPERTVEKELKKLQSMSELERLVELQGWPGELNRHIEKADGTIGYCDSDDFLHEMIMHINARMANLKTQEKLGLSTDADRQELALLKKMHKAIVTAQYDRIHLRDRREAEKVVDDGFESMKDLESEDLRVELTAWAGRLNERQPIPPCHPTYRYADEQLDMMLKRIDQRLESELLTNSERALLEKMKKAIRVAKAQREQDHHDFPFPHVIAEKKGA